MSETRSLASITVGEKLPSLEIPLSRTLIVATAIASRDYQDVDLPCLGQDAVKRCSDRGIIRYIQNHG